MPIPLADLVALAVAAGEAILVHYRAATGAFETKEDDSPVTAADHAAEAVILPGLTLLAPAIPVVSEERGGTAGGRRFWLVDPLDGTKEYLKRNGEFTVNIALIEDGAPVMGVVHAPALGRTFYGDRRGAWRRDGDGAPQPIRVRPAPGDGLTVVASHSHGDMDTLERFLQSYRVAHRRSIGSSLKLCLVAAGEADLYPRFGRTMEWDIAAGDAVLRAAGGIVRTVEGDPMPYGKPGLANPPFVAYGWRDPAGSP